MTLTLNIAREGEHLNFILENAHGTLLMLGCSQHPNKPYLLRGCNSCDIAGGSPECPYGGEHFQICVDAMPSVKFTLWHKQQLMALLASAPSIEEKLLRLLDFCSELEVV